MHRFYAPSFALDREIALPQEEAHHLAHVVRLSVGDAIAVFDGAGNEAEARVQTIRNRTVTVLPLRRREAAKEPAIAITLAQAILKGDKMDRVIRDAVMLGAAAIQPLTTARTELPGAAARASGRRDRWLRTTIASVKQSGRAVVPAVWPAKTMDEFLAAERDVLSLMFVEPGAEASPVELRTLQNRVPAKATIVIGPEGGWDPDELERAVANGVTLVTLGERVLRADAAGAIAIAVLQFVWDDR